MTSQGISILYRHLIWWLDSCGFLNNVKYEFTSILSKVTGSKFMSGCVSKINWINFKIISPKDYYITS